MPRRVELPSLHIQVADTSDLGSVPSPRLVPCALLRPGQTRTTAPLPAAPQRPGSRLQTHSDPAGEAGGARAAGAERARRRPPARPSAWPLLWERARGRSAPPLAVGARAAGQPLSRELRRRWAGPSGAERWSELIPGAGGSAAQRSRAEPGTAERS